MPNQNDPEPARQNLNPWQIVILTAVFTLALTAFGCYLWKTSRHSILSPAQLKYLEDFEALQKLASDRADEAGRLDKEGKQLEAAEIYIDLAGMEAVRSAAAGKHRPAEPTFYEWSALRELALSGQDDGYAKLLKLKYPKWKRDALSSPPPPQ